MSKESPFHRLHRLRLENDAAKFAMEEMAPRFEKLAARHENGTAPRAVSAYQLFQTPPELAARLVGLLDLQPGARVLEPSAGLGRLLDAAKPYQPREVVAVEVAPQCAGELFRQEREGVKILQRDFLTIEPQEIGCFDGIAMNPPFHCRADLKHIFRAVDLLKPNGKLAGICMNTHHRERALKHLCDTWEALPGSTFGVEGTSTPTVLFSITKRV